ncbi:MAG: DinB family protein [Gemmata sp.]
MQRPDATEHAPYFAKYTALVPEDDLLAALAAQLTDPVGFWRGIPESQGDVCHAPYTWTVKQVIGHLADGERVFGYRALRFARGDATPLPGFDENEYAKAVGYERLSVAAVVDEFETARRANLALFRNLPEAAWTRAGEANGHRMSVRALAAILVGHVRHHDAILRKRLASVVTSR